MSSSVDLETLVPFFDLGHQGEVDYTQLRRFLAMTPTERLRQHESWRLFVKEAIARAKLRGGSDRSTDPGAS